jgi:hypothetical protein
LPVERTPIREPPVAIQRRRQRLYNNVRGGATRVLRIDFWKRECEVNDADYNLRSIAPWSVIMAVLLVVSGCQSGVPTRSRVRPTSTEVPPTSYPPAATESVLASQPSPTPGRSGGSLSQMPSTGPTPRSTAPVETPIATAAIPHFDHIYVIVFENKESSDIVGSSDAPYLNSLIGQYGLATGYHSIAHPSQPNYLALWSGSTFGVQDDGVHDLAGNTIADQLDAHGMTWKVFAENYPVNATSGGPACFTGASAKDGEDGTGTYARKHDPAMSFTNLSGNPSRCASHITDFSHFDAAAADFSFVVPNLCHDMHDCPVSTGDSWLKQWLPDHVLNTSAWKTTNSAVFITWDEGTAAAGGSVPLIVISHLTSPGTASGNAHNHYSLLRTIEDAWSLGCLRESCQASALTELFSKTGK